MRIGLIAPPWVPVPPMTYGGTEEVVDDLARGLARRSHDIRLFTVGESTCPVSRGWYYPTAVEPMGTSLEEAAHVIAAYEALADVDVIHDHTMLGPLLAPGLGRLPPIVVTQHNPFTAEARVILRKTASTASLVAISHAQRATAPEVPVAAVIHHGIDLDAFPYGEGDGAFLLFVGRMSPDKGLHRAIQVARGAGCQLVAVSKNREPEEHAYYEQMVRPLLGKDVEVLEEISVAEHRKLFQSATALLNPICWSEPFGLVMVQALACGTPVLSFPNGAAPEIVDPGRTGFLPSDEAGMVAAVERVGEIDRHACRLEAERRFGMNRMAADYEALFAHVVAARGPARRPPAG